MNGEASFAFLNNNMMPNACKKWMTILKKYCVIQKFFVPLQRIGNGACHYLIFILIL